MARLGVFGGTFDPPHLAHLILAAEAYYQFSLDRVLWVLTPDPPHKEGKPITSFLHRLDMVMAAIDQNPAFELSRVDIDRPPPHFAVDTLKILQGQYPQESLVSIMGGDSLRDLPKWHNPIEFLAACSVIGVMRRPGDAIDLVGLERQLPGLREKIQFINAPLLQISASQLRERLAVGKSIRYYVPDTVGRIIKNRKLY